MVNIMDKIDILLVDDSEVTHKIVQECFKDSNYNLLSAYDSKSAISKLGNNEAQLIILDINLPGRDGFEICKDIKEEEEIYLTSLSTEEFSIMGDKLGKEYEEDTEQIKSKELLEVFNRSAVNHMDKQNSSLDDSIINFLSKNMANWF